MKWEISSAERFVDNQEYIDTALIPVFKLELGSVYKESLRQATWLTGIAHALEEQLMGRVMLFPSLTYVESEEEGGLSQKLHAYLRYFQEHQFQHVVFLCLENNQKDLCCVGCKETELDLLPIRLPVTDKLEFSKVELEEVAQKYLSDLIKLWQI